MTSEQFDIFWRAYPRKVGKFLAAKVWLKLKDEEGLLDKIIRSVQIQKQSDGWQKEGGIFIPHPSTWLNQRRWEDEVLPGRNVARIEAQSVVDPSKLEAAKKRTQDLMEREWIKRNGGQR